MVLVAVSGGRAALVFETSVVVKHGVQAAAAVLAWRARMPSLAAVVRVVQVVRALRRLFLDLPSLTREVAVAAEALVDFSRLLLAVLVQLVVVVVVART